MEDALTILWLLAGLFGPLFGFLIGRAVWRFLRPRGRASLAVGTALIFVLAASPASLTGVLADHLALVAAFLTLCVLAAGAARAALRPGVLSVVATPLVLVALYAAFGGAAFVLNSDYGPPERAIYLECGYAVHLRPYGWVASSGTVAVVYWRPALPVVEFERGRHRFGDLTYDPRKLSARAVRDGGRCSAVVTYDGAEAWRVQ